MNHYLLIGLVIIACLVVGAWFHRRDSRRFLRLFSRQAEKRGGSVTTGSLFAMPQLQIEVNGIEMRVTVMTNSESDAPGMLTCADFRVPHEGIADLQVRERRKGIKAALDDAFLGEVSSLAEPRFDERFGLRAKNLQQAQALMGHEPLRRLLLELPEGADLQINHGTCVISIAGVPGTEELLERLIDAALAAAYSIKELSGGR
jgi:hypothetical protein